MALRSGDSPEMATNDQGAGGSPVPAGGVATTPVETANEPESARVPHAVEVKWDGGKRLRGGVEGGPTILLDGSRETGPSPVDTLVIAMASCSALDVLSILEKRREPARSLEVKIRFSRRTTPPRRLTEAHLEWRVDTPAERHHVERAIGLSMEKYCSVSASLAPDTELTWSVVDD